jgi:hypothetical protein
MVTALALALVAIAPAASAATYVDGRLFGLHVPTIANGTIPSVSYGSVRLWDSGVSWGMVEQSRGRYWWAGLDRAVSAANSQGAELVYVLGSTPRWAAKYISQGTYPNKGAASNPRYISDWRRWVTKVATRYGASIDAYQIWNEANLRTFWQGTPRQMAILTWEAKRIIRRIDPTARVVAASSTVRLTSSFSRFFPSYLAELRRLNWPVDVFAIHTYGPSTATPALRASYVARTRVALKRAGAPRRPLWDTEVNYGMAGPGAAYPDQDVEGPMAAIDVSQTYLDSLRLGIARTFWYAWTPPSELLGVTMFGGSVGATAFQVTHDWVTGASVACGSGVPRVCFVNRAGVLSQIAWTSSGPDALHVVPAYATSACTAMGVCTPVVPGSSVPVGRMPTRFAAA